MTPYPVRNLTLPPPLLTHRSATTPSQATAATLTQSDAPFMTSHSFRVHLCPRPSLTGQQLRQAKPPQPPLIHTSGVLSCDYSVSRTLTLFAPTPLPPPFLTDRSATTPSRDTAADTTRRTGRACRTWRLVWGRLHTWAASASRARPHFRPTCPGCSSWCSNSRGCRGDSNRDGSRGKGIG